MVEGTSQTTPRWNYGGDLRVRVSLMFNSFPRVLDRRLFPRQQETDDSGNKYKIYYILPLSAGWTRKIGSTFRNELFRGRSLLDGRLFS